MNETAWHVVLDVKWDLSVQICLSFQKDVCSQEAVSCGQKFEQSVMAPYHYRYWSGFAQAAFTTDASGRIIHGSERLEFLLDAQKSCYLTREKQVRQREDSTAWHGGRAVRALVR